MLKNTVLTVVVTVTALIGVVTVTGVEVKPVKVNFNVEAPSYGK